MSDAGSRLGVTVLLFAAAREAAGREQCELTMTAPATAGDLLARLVSELPALATHRATLRLAVNQAYVELDHQLADGDEVAVIPPVCGG
jgi:molybdopterin synthase catalytic subunit